MQSDTHFLSEDGDGQYQHLIDTKGLLWQSQKHRGAADHSEQKYQQHQ